MNRPGIPPSMSSQRPIGPKPIDILVVDDSALIRERLKSIIETDPRFRVLTATDPYDAVAQLAKSVPGVILLDVEMPKMDGLTFLRKLMRQHPLPVVLCTSVAERAVAALEMGALEVIPKPNWHDPNALQNFSHDLLESIRNAARAGRHLPVHEARVDDSADVWRPADVVLPKVPYVARGGIVERVISVGTSTGGTQALHKLLSGFPPDAPGIVIVQHLPEGFVAEFARSLNANPKIEIEVALARHLEPIRPGRALVIPGTHHGLVRRTGVGYRVELVEGLKVCRHRPSVEVLFRSTAQAAGPYGVGILLTGMGDDGASGLLEMRQAGALTIAQDEATSAVHGMPGNAIRLGAARIVLPLERVAGAAYTGAGHVLPDSGSRHG